MNTASMEFWGVEVKAGEPLKVSPPKENIIHMSQAALGESKKDKAKEFVPLSVKCGDQKIVIGTLSAESFPQISFDLVFEKDFELSHNWKYGSVFFSGYKVPLPEEEDYPASEFSDSDDEEEVPLVKPETAVAKKETVAAKPAVKASKPESSGKQVKVIEPSKDEDDDSSDDSDDDSDEDGFESGHTMSEDDDEDDESEDEETPAKVEKVKKRSNDSAVKTPASKKAKLTTPQKTDGKKGGHISTPHPSKQAGKTPANGSVSKSQTTAKSPKSSGGQFTCDSCSKSFGKEVGLQSHIKAKHT